MIDLRKIIKSLMQKDCPNCGKPVDVAYPYYNNDGTRFVVCRNCNYRLELDK